MHPAKTFELRISFSGASTRSQEALATKESVMDWLHAHDVDSFVEGAIDDLDIDNEFGVEQKNFYDELGGDFAPLSIFKYSLEYLEDLRRRVEHKFLTRVRCAIHEQDTIVWMEGWKESFKPVETARFYIYPPWEKKTNDATKTSVIIEPGMAFGTGQHATTLLCLEVFEELCRDSLGDLQSLRLCDVGTGTGILAIAAAKLGVGGIVATDIDEDAISAVRANAMENNVAFETRVESVPLNDKDGFDLVFANILAVVLKKIAPDLSAVCRPGGYVIMSGLLEEQMPELLDVCAKTGLKLVAHKLRADWCALLLQKET